MAPRVSENPETRAYYAAQAALGYQLAAAVREFWGVLNPTNLVGTFPDLRAIAGAFGQRSSAAAVALAADYYTDLRDSVNAAGRYSVPIIEAPAMADIERKIDEASSALLASTEAVVDDLYYAEIMAQIEAEVAGAVQAVAADTGLDELFEAMGNDREAKGWARVVRPGACSFCRMLATRGPVYRTRYTANFRAHDVVNGRGGTCQCTAEPLFNAYEAPAQVRADTALWEQIEREGFRGRDAMVEFRRRIEGRADGRRIVKRTGSSDRRLATPTEVQGQRLGFDFLTVDQLKHQLSVLEGLPDSTYRSQQIDRVRSRLAVLGAS